MKKHPALAIRKPMPPPTTVIPDKKRKLARKRIKVVYQLFTDNRREWWIKASNSMRAVQLAEYLSNARVICWLVGNTPPATFKVYNA